MIDDLRALQALDWLIGGWVCIVPILHSFAVADLVLRRPAAVLLTIGFPVLLVFAITGGLAREGEWFHASLLLAPYLQYWIVRWLYPRFRRRHGRDPQDVYKASQEVPASDADLAFFAFGGAILTVAPIAAAYIVSVLVKALAT